MRRNYNPMAQQPAYQSHSDDRSRILNGPVPSNRPPASIIQAAEPMYASFPRGPLLQDQPMMSRQSILDRPNILDRPSIQDVQSLGNRPSFFDHRQTGPLDYPNDYDSRINHQQQLHQPHFYEPQGPNPHFGGPGGHQDFGGGRRRERGFDKGPQGDLVQFQNDIRDNRGQYNNGHMPNKPVESYITYEKVGGDMEIARSRSNSPRESRFSSKWRPPGESRNRDKSFSSSKRGRSPRPSKENSQNYESVSEDTVRDGIIYSNNAFYSFLTYWISKLDDESRKSNDRDVQGSRKLVEIFTKANRMERHKLVLPPEFKESDRNQMLHCDITVLGLPSAIFFGSGYGPKNHSGRTLWPNFRIDGYVGFIRETFSKHAAAKDLVDKCHRIGIISSELHAAIGDNRSFDRKVYSREIFQAIDALIHLRKAMANENFPKQIMSQRELEPAVIDRFKLILRTLLDVDDAISDEE